MVLYFIFFFFTIYFCTILLHIVCTAISLIEFLANSRNAKIKKKKNNKTDFRMTSMRLKKKKKNFLSKLINYSSGTFFLIFLETSEIFRMKKITRDTVYFTLPNV